MPNRGAALNAVSSLCRAAASIAPMWLVLGMVTAYGAEPGATVGKPEATAESARSSKFEPLRMAGPERGSMIHSFFVRAVTGPHRNRSVCYVCRYGPRPVVMVLMQKVDPRVSELLKEVDRIVDGKRATGLRGFGVLVTDESTQAVPILQTMAFDEKIRLPLTAATTAVAGPGCHNLHPDAATTIVFYRNQKAVEAIALRDGGINARLVHQVARKLEEFSTPLKPVRGKD